MVAWVVLDLGETLVDEARCWREWARHLDVPEFTFFAAFGSVIADRRPHTDVFALVRPNFDPASGGVTWIPTVDDLYPDALATLDRLRRGGFRVAVMANQPTTAEALLAALPLDAYATSERWGLAKPDPAFFARVADELGAEASDIAYVGDRVDNDVLPAKAAGMTAVHLRRGPWGVIHATWPEAAKADARIENLSELPDVLTSPQTVWSSTRSGTNSRAHPQDRVEHVDIDTVREIVAGLPRSYEVLVRGRVKFRVGRIVYLAFSHDEEEMGFAFPKEEREAMLAAEPEKFVRPIPSDMRYNWLEVRLEALDRDELTELVLDAWRMVVPRSVAVEHLGP